MKHVRVPKEIAAVEVQIFSSLLYVHVCVWLCSASVCVCLEEVKQS